MNEPDGYGDFRGIRVLEARKALSMTRLQLAMKVRCTENAVYLWEIGVNQPTAGNLGRLALALGVKVAYFFGRSDL